MCSSTWGATEYIRAEPRVLWRVPENVTFEQAAAIGGIPLDTAVRLIRMTATEHRFL
jgi:NADPH:quinone reductase-like Zn-dependent oxidoreductase